MMMDMVEFTRYLKDHTLLHVHHGIDCTLERFRVHRSIHVYARELLAIPEVSRDVIVDYVTTPKKLHGT
jgi:hypothetical protein